MFCNKHTSDGAGANSKRVPKKNRTCMFNIGNPNYMEYIHSLRYEGFTAKSQGNIFHFEVFQHLLLCNNINNFRHI